MLVQILRTPVVCALVAAAAALMAGPLMEANMSTRLFHQRLTRFYEVHAPDKVANVDGLVEKYEGREGELIAKLEKQYQEVGAVVPEGDVWALGDPVGASVFTLYRAAKAHAATAGDMLHEHFPAVGDLGQRVSNSFRHARKVLDDTLSPSAQLLVLAVAYLLASTRVKGVARVFALIAVFALGVYVVQPSVGSCGPAELLSAVQELYGEISTLWASASKPARAASAVAVAAVAAFTVLKDARVFSAACALAVVLAVYKPEIPEGTTPLQLAASLDIVDTKAYEIFQQSERSVVDVVDFGVCSLLVLMPGEGSELSLWNSAMLAVGAADRWVPLSPLDVSYKSSKVTIAINGLSVPVATIPAMVFVSLFLQGLLSALF